MTKSLDTQLLLIISRIFCFVPLGYLTYESNELMYDGDTSCWLELIKQIQFLFRNVFDCLMLGYYLQ